MGLCANDTKRRRPFKTIIIPRGIINPHEHNVIEIPLSLDTSSNLIVRAPTDANSCFSVEPYRGDLVNPRPRVQTYTGEMTVPMSSAMPMPMYVPQVPSTTEQCQGVSCVQGSTTVRIPRERPKKVDFSCQTQDICAVFQKWPCSEQSTQSYYPVEHHSIRQPPQVQDAHSPLCPICARASCKYLSNSGINRPFSSRFGQFSSTLAQSDPYNVPSVPYTYPTPCYRETSMRLPSARSDMLSPTRVDHEMLNRMLDEKIDKILKPVLISISRIYPEDEDREKYVSSTCPTKYSCTSIRPKYSREQFCVRKYDDEFKMANTASYCSTYDVPDYEDFKRELRKRDSDYVGHAPKAYYKGTDFDLDESRRRNVGADRDPLCPASASCQKRAGVSFNDAGNSSISKKLNERIDLHATSQDSLIKKKTNL